MEAAPVSYPLTTPSYLFVGRKLAAVFFGGELVEVKTWRGVYSVIIGRCNQDPRGHEKLMYLRNKAAGKVRKFLSDKPDGMTRPHRIDEDLWGEVHYGSATLHHILLNQILFRLKSCVLYACPRLWNSTSIPAINSSMFIRCVNIALPSDNYSQHWCCHIDYRGYMSVFAGIYYRNFSGGRFKRRPGNAEAHFIIRTFVTHKRLVFGAFHIGSDNTFAPITNIIGAFR
jgi:hypothetical protein